MESLKNNNPYLEGKNIVLALSGGIDSVVLLHYLHTHYANNLRVIHCNHHLSKYCDEWEKFCSNLCKSLDIDYINIDIHLEKVSNIEENARKSRYYSLSSNLKKNEVLCTAHHKNDQAETLLLQLFRGSGVPGLAAMPISKPFSKGLHYRPMLNISQSEILVYAKQHNLSWVEDDSNTDKSFHRIFLRLDIIPKLETVYKNLVITLARSAQHQSEALHLTQDLAKIDIGKYQIMNDDKLNVDSLIQLKPHRIKNVVRYHLTQLKFLAPSDKVMQQVLKLLVAKEDATPLVKWQTFEVRRYQSELYFINTKVLEDEKICTYYNEFKDLAGFEIRYRIEGQRIKLVGKTHSQSLKKVLQAAHIPPWKRDHLRMYYVEDVLKAIESIGYTSEL